MTDRSLAHPPTLPVSVLAAPTPDAAAVALGAFLGLEGAAPVDAARRAQKDPYFAQGLYAARKMPAVIRQMLVAPDTVRFPQARAATPAAEEPLAPPPPPGTGSVLAKAGAAVLKWGMSGLKHAQPWQIETRIAACNACPHQAPAPDTLIYRGAKVVAGKDARICTLCHCLTNTKAALATETCPDRDPAAPALSRWQEPYVDPQDSGLWR